MNDCSASTAATACSISISQTSSVRYLNALIRRRIFCPRTPRDEHAFSKLSRSIHSSLSGFWKVDCVQRYAHIVSADPTHNAS